MERALDPTERKNSDQLSIQVFSRLIELMGILDREINHFFAEKKLSKSRYQVLKFLYHASAPVASIEIAAAIGVTPASITGLVDLLVEASLIQKSWNEIDRRKVKLEVTGHGKEFFERLIKEYNRIVLKIGRQYKNEDKKLLLKLIEQLLDGISNVNLDK